MNSGTSVVNARPASATARSTKCTATRRSSHARTRRTGAEAQRLATWAGDGAAMRGTLTVAAPCERGPPRDRARPRSGGGHGRRAAAGGRRRDHGCGLGLPRIGLLLRGVGLLLRGVGVRVGGLLLGRA